MEKITAKAMSAVASHFALIGIERCCSQSASKGPKNRLRNKRWCIAGDDRAKQAAANKMNGVVGRPGKKMPMMPKMTLSIPTNSSIHFLSCSIPNKPA